MRGRHVFRIDQRGVSVFPRLESTVAEAEPSLHPTAARVSCGVVKLDAMLGGGLPPWTTTAVIGTPGSGKTSLGLQFLSQSTSQEPGLLFGFFESPDSARTSAESLGIDLAGLEHSGAMRIVWQPQAEHLLDELAQRLLSIVDETGARRLLIDGYEALVESAVHENRMTRFMTALSIKLRARNVTTLITIERHDRLGVMHTPLRGSSAIFDNFVLVRHIEQHGRLVRLLSVTKVRGSAFDSAVHTFEITSRGLDVGSAWDEGVTPGPSMTNS